MKAKAALMCAMGMSLILSPVAPAIAQAKVSRPGVYSGYSPELYDGYERSSRYVAMRDGTKIAIDIFRPTLKGAPVDKPLPVLWMNTPYNRRGNSRGEDTAASYPGAALALVKYGYVVAIADVRGNYASFGKAVHDNRSEWMPWTFWDAYDITEWLAKQSWSDSKIGMWGCSATGHTQWQAAATRPPHLKAIYPMSAPSEYYDWGGIAATAPEPAKPYPGPLSKRDDSAAAVDEDKDGALLAAAKEEHRYNSDYGWLPYRDSVSSDMARNLGVKGFRPGLEVNTFTHLDAINESGIPAYETANFGEDMRVKLGVAVKLASVRNPIKLIYAPGNHCNWSSDYKVDPNNPFNATVEEHRWFDYWLKGIDNGIMAEPPITLYTYNMPAAQAWRSAWQWPLPTAHDTAFYFAPSTGGARSGVNDGGLGTAAPTGAGDRDSYAADYSVTKETQNDKGVTYTSAPLAADAPMIGHPVIHLWMTTTATDADVLAFLADVAPDGKVTPLPGTDDGRLRASHRALGKPPYADIGLPYHRSFAADVSPLKPGEATELVFDLAPISWVFKAGHRIRLILTNTSQERHSGASLTPVVTPPPTISILRDRAHPSRILMPLNRAIDVSARLVRTGGGMTAYLSFPKALDRRYLGDVSPAAISANGVAATRTRVEGAMLVAEFDGAAPARKVTVRGRLGDRYDYGDLMAFTVDGTLER